MASVASMLVLIFPTSCAFFGQCKHKISTASVAGTNVLIFGLAKHLSQYNAFNLPKVNISLFFFGQHAIL